MTCTSQSGPPRFFSPPFRSATWISYIRTCFAIPGGHGEILSKAFHIAVSSAGAGGRWDSETLCVPQRWLMNGCNTTQWIRQRSVPQSTIQDRLPVLQVSWAPIYLIVFPHLSPNPVMQTNICSTLRFSAYLPSHKVLYFVATPSILVVSGLEVGESDTLAGWSWSWHSGINWGRKWAW